MYVLRCPRRQTLHGSRRPTAIAFETVQVHDAQWERGLLMSKERKRAKKSRLILVESTEPVASIMKKLRDQGVDEAQVMELWVRTPDDPKPRRMRYASRLCSCNTVCIGGPPPPPPPDDD